MTSCPREQSDDRFDLKLDSNIQDAQIQSRIE
jgi:hypothetical protein